MSESRLSNAAQSCHRSQIYSSFFSLLFLLWRRCLWVKCKWIHVTVCRTIVGTWRHQMPFTSHLCVCICVCWLFFSFVTGRRRCTHSITRDSFLSSRLCKVYRKEEQKKEEPDEPASRFHTFPLIVCQTHRGEERRVDSNRRHEKYTDGVTRKTNMRCEWKGRTVFVASGRLLIKELSDKSCAA